MPSIDVSAPVSLKRRAIWAGAWNVLSLVPSQVLRLGGNLIIARLLVPEMFGVMVIATTVSVLLHLLSDVGLRQNIIQSRRGDDPLFLNTAWTVQIIRGFVLFSLTLLLAVASWLGNVGKDNKMFFFPMIFMLIATITSLIMTIIKKFGMIGGGTAAWGDWFQLVWSMGLVVLAIMLVIQGIGVLSKQHGKKAASAE